MEAGFYPVLYLPSHTAIKMVPISGDGAYVVVGTNDWKLCRERTSLLQSSAYWHINDAR